MRARDFLREAAGLATQLYAPRPESINESFGFKPEVKVWTSTAIKTADGITSEWVRWCDAEMPDWIGDTGFLLDVAPAAKILTIRSDRDAVAVAQQYGAQFKNSIELMTKMPWAEIGRDYDAVHYTAENNWQDTIMRAWDVESTAWFNPGVLGNKRAVQLARDPDYLDEMAGKIHGGIRQALMAKGYQYLGGGIDKQAYLEPNGQVYIVFGYRKGFENISPDQRMFVNWIAYCNKNRNNPHLPRFSGFETFEFQGRKYIQARMETLRELPDEIGHLVGGIQDAVKKINKNNIDKAFEVIADYAEVEAPGFYTVEKTIELLGGPEQAKNLLKTIKIVEKFARQNNYSLDLHSGNYMQRPDGTIVVNDPYVLFERNL